MLSDSTVVAMVAVKDLEQGKEFYGETLGLKLVDENQGGVAYQSGTGKVFVYPSPTAGTNQATSANWDVPDVAAAVAELKAKGVSSWERYDYPGVEHEGEVHLMGPLKAAWFRDPSGNILGLTEAGTT
jgi:catechol 2,3-dioxygenase-like lactoylglutathione lyase family enzyme